MKRLGVIGVLTLAVVATACSSAAGRDEAGVIVKAGSVKVHELEIGDCLASAGVEASDTVNAVPCAEPHLSQVYHVYHGLPSDG
ncbi:MAG: hypothetical protein CSA55_05650 [Ilumatobacter coccineus]|uniref:Uncharacterized protein n=1 Tax=Ilumatobacter coccineus TaxID=467094 RepID=A0A2G6K7Q7_9ACTN|nr:MAG: hypothetical protein CSA55_05650 [Ilumatobacter coccineus]